MLGGPDCVACFTWHIKQYTRNLPRDISLNASFTGAGHMPLGSGTTGVGWIYEILGENLPPPPQNISALHTPLAFQLHRTLSAFLRLLLPACHRKEEKIQDIQSLGVSQRPLTLILLQKHRDTNGRRIVIQIGGVCATFCQEEGILLQKASRRK